LSGRGHLRISGDEAVRTPSNTGGVVTYKGGKEKGGGRLKRRIFWVGKSSTTGREEARTGNKKEYGSAGLLERLPGKKRGERRGNHHSSRRRIRGSGRSWGGDG